MCMYVYRREAAHVCSCSCSCSSSLSCSLSRWLLKRVTSTQSTSSVIPASTGLLPLGSVESVVTVNCEERLTSLLAILD